MGGALVGMGWVSGSGGAGALGEEGFDAGVFAADEADARGVFEEVAGFLDDEVALFFGQLATAAAEFIDGEFAQF